MLVKILVTMVTMVTVTNGARILMLPWKNASHYLEMDGIGRPLVARGHQVYVALDDNTMLPKNSPYQLITYRAQYGEQHQIGAMFNNKMIENSKSGMNLTAFSEVNRLICTDMMSDKEFHNRLRNLSFDLVLLDNNPMACFFLTPYQLGIPFVTLSTFISSWVQRLPYLPSVVQPSAGLDVFGVSACEETEQQNALVRSLCRLVALLVGEVFFSRTDTQYFAKFAGAEHQVFPSMNEIRQNVSLTLVNFNYLLSGPLPKLPQVEYVGGLTTKPAKPLQGELEQWMSLSANVVVVSFGSMYTSLPMSIATKLFDAFGRLPHYRFLMRFQGANQLTLTLPTNVLLQDWLPQNDLLGHNSTRAFITHSGNNGQQEALYHGIPMLCFYIHGDQKTNARRVAERGYGKMLDIHDFTVDGLVSDLSELLENKSYLQRIKKASQIFHDDKHPSERAADAIEYVLKYGAEQLQPKEALSLTWWQYYMVDVVFLIYSVILALLFATYKFFKYLLTFLFSRSSKSKTE